MGGRYLTTTDVGTTTRDLEYIRSETSHVLGLPVAAGGIIDVSTEIGVPYNSERAREKTERIYEIMGWVIQISKSEEIPTASAADRLAEARIASVKAMNKICRTVK